MSGLCRYNVVIIVVALWMMSLSTDVQGFSFSPIPKSVTTTSTSSTPPPNHHHHNKNEYYYYLDEGKEVTRRQVMTTTTSRMTTAAIAAAAMIIFQSDSVAAVESTSLDFSLPKYDTNMQGFGDGVEAYTSKIGTSNNNNNNSMTDPGANEKEKQLRSMQLAEEARQAALAKKRADAKLRDEEARRRAAEKKAKDAERFASIFN